MTDTLGKPGDLFVVTCEETERQYVFVWEDKDGMFFNKKVLGRLENGEFALLVSPEKDDNVKRALTRFGVGRITDIRIELVKL